METGRVYKIVSSKSNKVYVGSTFYPLTIRFNNHKSSYKRYKNGKLKTQCSSFDIFDSDGIENCKCEMIREYLVIDEHHLHAYEFLWMKKLHSVNIIEPMGKILKKQYNKLWREHNKEYIAETNAAYYEKNKERISKRSADYYQSNREHLLKKQKQYVNEHKEEIKSSRKAYAEKHKTEIKAKKRDYYEKNKDAFKEKGKQYYTDNRERVLARMSERVECRVCNITMNQSSMHKHVTTKSHLSNVTE